jgi:hypothetical protein
MQVSVWVPIVVGLIGVLGVVAGQLVTAAAVRKAPATVDLDQASRHLSATIRALRENIRQALAIA